MSVRYGICGCCGTELREYQQLKEMEKDYEELKKLVAAAELYFGKEEKNE
jgi:hypothetical protein